MLQRRHLLQLGAAAIALTNKRSLFVYTCIQPGLPKPEFWFGDQVCLEWQCDDELDLENFGKPLQDYGVVIGLFFSGGSRRYAPGWNYFVSWRWVNGEAVENSDWDSAVHESELKLSDRSLAPRCH